MAAQEADNGADKHVKTAANWTKIITGILAAALLGLQGVNLSEVTHGNENGEKRMQVLEQLLSISQDMETSLKNQTQILKSTETALTNQSSILENGSKLLSHDEEALTNQTEILKTLKAAIDERRELLKNQNPKD